MRIGLDFDNTIACYDRAIANLADELFNLPHDIQRTKLGLRDYLHKVNKENDWTTFQGELYGPGMKYADTFENAIEVMQHLASKGHELIIVSHRSVKPYAGQAYDLHAAAKHWIQENLQSRGLFNEDETSINFLDTKKEKISCIAKLNCRVFVDDLPEILNDSKFPSTTQGILFDPLGEKGVLHGYLPIMNWSELLGIISGLS